MNKHVWKTWHGYLTIPPVPVEFTVALNLYCGDPTKLGEFRKEGTAIFKGDLDERTLSISKSESMRLGFEVTSFLQELYMLYIARNKESPANAELDAYFLSEFPSHDNTIEVMEAHALKIDVCLLFYPHPGWNFIIIPVGHDYKAYVTRREHVVDLQIAVKEVIKSAY